MEFVENVNEKEYTEFVLKNKYNDFLQSYEWGQVIKKTRKQIPHYVGLKENGSLVATCLLLETKLPLNLCYYYAPRGFILDYNNYDLIAKFTNYLKEYLRKNRAIYLKIDPGLMYQEVDKEAKTIKDGKNNYELYNYLIKLGYLHQGFNKLYEKNQPRYTFRISLDDDFDNIYNKFSKTRKKNIKSAKDFNVNVRVGNQEDIKIFYELISKTGNRDNFKPYSLAFYQTFYNDFHEKGYADLFIGTIKPKDMIGGLKNNLKEAEVKNNDRLVNELKEEILKYEKLDNKEIPVCGHLLTYYGDIATALYAGNDATYKESCTNYLMYYEKIKYYHDKGAKYMDLFGVVGDPHTKYKNLAGIYNFKEQWGGDCIEFIGEFDLVNKKYWYKILPILLKIYRMLRK